MARLDFRDYPEDLVKELRRFYPDNQGVAIVLETQPLQTAVEQLTVTPNAAGRPEQAAAASTPAPLFALMALAVAGAAWCAQRRLP